MQLTIIGIDKTFEPDFGPCLLRRLDKNISKNAQRKRKSSKTGEAAECGNPYVMHSIRKNKILS